MGGNSCITWILGKPSICTVLPALSIASLLTVNTGTDWITSTGPAGLVSCVSYNLQQLLTSVRGLLHMVEKNYASLCYFLR